MLPANVLDRLGCPNTKVMNGDPLASRHVYSFSEA